MSAWDAVAWIKAFNAAGGSVALHGNEITVGWRMDDDEQQVKARELYDEYRSDPARRYLVAAALKSSRRVEQPAA